MQQSIRYMPGGTSNKNRSLESSAAKLHPRAPPLLLCSASPHSYCFPVGLWPDPLVPGTRGSVFNEDLADLLTRSWVRYFVGLLRRIRVIYFIMSQAEEMPFGHLTITVLQARDIDGARDEILNLVHRINNDRTIYFDGWYGAGTIAVLRSVVQKLQSMKHTRPKLCFDRVLYIDCSTWKSKRVLQRRIAEELKLERETMSMFDEQDEEDDFAGVDPTSRDAIRGVAKDIAKNLKDSRFVMIFINGSDEEVFLSRLGVPEFNDSIILWTFRGRSLTEGLFFEEIRTKLRNTNIFLSFLDPPHPLTSSEVSALIRAEAASILTHHPYMRDGDRAMVIDSYLYVQFLHHSFCKGTRRQWGAHGANYWICDGIIQGARTWEISKELYQEVSFECDDTFFDSKIFKRIMQLHPRDSSYMVFHDGDHYPLGGDTIRPCRWISITHKNMLVRENMKNILARASSIFLLFGNTSSPQGLPDDLMEQCRNLRVLILSNCSFDFLSPLFGHCSTLRFLGLDHCINNCTIEHVDRDPNEWACLRNLWVLDLRYTDWDEILSEEKMDLMGNIMELNIQGSMCWQYIADKFEGRLPSLGRLRIVKPLREAESSTEINDNSFMGKTNLEVVDLSGNKDMKTLPTSLSQASNLQVLVLDGCAGLENVVLSNFLLRSFSFDGYGPASNWTSSMDELPLESSRPKCPSNDDEKDVKTSRITLEGCTQLKNLFLRRLPNLVELDLSGCAIKILDLETMVVNVPRLKRLFLLGCEHLRAIRWGTHINTFSRKEEQRMPVELELLCIDTRRPAGDRVTRPSIAAHQDPNKNFGLHVHAVTPDARLTPSLWPPINLAKTEVFFNICISNSSETGEEPAGDHQQDDHAEVSSLYDGVSTEVGDSLIVPMQAFPQPPASRSDRHVEIGDGSCSVGSEVRGLASSNLANLAILMSLFVQSLHVHDTSTSTAIPRTRLVSLQWCRVERCPRLDPVFPPEAGGLNLETIWASHLLMARCIWSKARPDYRANFGSLRHLHLRSCPSLLFALPIWTSSFSGLETLHIVHCGSLRHVFALDNEEYNINSTRVLFPNLTTIHLHDVPALLRICEVKMMTAPKLETIRTRGCWSLRRLPALLKPGGAGNRRRRPVVEMEKDVWDALEWDGVDTGHHPSLYEAPLHSRYYKARRLLRGTVLR